jgi:hypothetical protein
MAEDIRVEEVMEVELGVEVESIDKSQVLPQTHKYRQNLA